MCSCMYMYICTNDLLKLELTISVMVSTPVLHSGVPGF
jgi:hypothetical protein